MMILVKNGVFSPNSRPNREIKKPNNLKNKQLGILWVDLTDKIPNSLIRDLQVLSDLRKSLKG